MAPVSADRTGPPARRMWGASEDRLLARHIKSPSCHHPSYKKRASAPSMPGRQRMSSISSGGGGGVSAALRCSAAAGAGVMASGAGAGARRVPPRALLTTPAERLQWKWRGARAPAPRGTDGWGVVGSPSRLDKGSGASDCGERQSERLSGWHQNAQRTEGCAAGHDRVLNDISRRRDAARESARGRPPKQTGVVSEPGQQFIVIGIAHPSSDPCGRRRPPRQRRRRDPYPTAAADVGCGRMIAFYQQHRKAQVGAPGRLRRRLCFTIQPCG